MIAIGFIPFMSRQMPREDLVSNIRVRGVYGPSCLAQDRMLSSIEQVQLCERLCFLAVRRGREKKSMHTKMVQTCVLVWRRHWRVDNGDMARMTLPKHGGAATIDFAAETSLASTLAHPHTQSHTPPD